MDDEKLGISLRSQAFLDEMIGEVKQKHKLI